jgi:RNA polymerase sigma-70 factor, ECF subfamily
MTGGTAVATGYDLDAFRAELTGYCYRMLGSAFEAEDAVQETLVRAWRGLDRFEGRAALRSWLYRIATNVCLTMLGSPQRRARPMDLSEPGTARSPVPAPLKDAMWIGPVPDRRVLADDGGDPADVALTRETVRLAFVAALQHLPPKQRAVLILREVLSWSAQEVADLLDTTVASVNSALQRARATMATADVASDTLEPEDPDQVELLRRYVDAFERYDMDSLTSLLHEDATLSMPPLPLWMRGHDDISGFMLGTGSACRDSRLLPTEANGTPAFAQYKPGARPGTYEPWALIVLEITDGRIRALNFFLDTERLFPLFGFAPHLDDPGTG